MEIRPSADIRNKYNEISQYCKKSGKPVFLTVNGRGDMVVMSVEEYENRQEELNILRGLGDPNDILKRKLYTHEEAFAEIDKMIAEYKSKNEAK